MDAELHQDSIAFARSCSAACWLTADWVSASAAAAPEKLPCVETSDSTLSRRTSNMSATHSPAPTCMGLIEGENMRSVTWVVVEEVRSGGVQSLVSLFWSMIV
jgi:hypothetical protein